MTAKIQNREGEHENLFSGPTYYFLIITALLIATIFRLYGIDRLSLWADELWGVMACSRGSWIAMVQDLVTNDNHPPGYQTILYFVMQWFGDTETMVRMPSALAGVATVYLVYHLGKKLLSLEIGVIAAFIVAGSYQSIFYSQEARAYSLLALFCTLNAYYFLNLFVVEKITNKNTLLFSLSSLICAYLHYAGLLFVGCELILCLALIGINRNKKMLEAAAYAFGIIAVLYIKWIPVMIAQMHNDEFYWEKIPTVYSFFKTVSYLVGPDSSRTFLYSASLLAALFFSGRNFLILSAARNNERRIIPVIIFLAAMPLLVVLIQSWLFSSIYTNRYFILVIPLVSIVCAYGLISIIELIASKKARRAAYSAVLVCVCLSAVVFNRDLYVGTFGKQDFRSAAAFVARDGGLISERGLVIVSHEFFNHYLKKYQGAYQTQGYLVFSHQLPQIVRKIKQSGAKSFYYLEVAETDKTTMNIKLSAHYQRVSSRHFNGINVTKYSVADSN